MMFRFELLAVAVSRETLEGGALVCNDGSKREHQPQIVGFQDRKPRLPAGALLRWSGTHLHVAETGAPRTQPAALVSE